MSILELHFLMHDSACQGLITGDQFIRSRWSRSVVAEGWRSAGAEGRDRLASQWEAISFSHWLVNGRAMVRLFTAHLHEDYIILLNIFLVRSRSILPYTPIYIYVHTILYPYVLPISGLFLFFTTSPPDMTSRKPTSWWSDLFMYSTRAWWRIPSGSPAKPRRNQRMVVSVVSEAGDVNQRCWKLMGFVLRMLVILVVKVDLV